MQIDDRLSIGSIIFEFVTDTNPPKSKYYIIVGATADKIALATVYINTEINPHVFRTEQLRNLHLPILHAEHPFLKYDSYIDCSNIHERATHDVEKCINSGDAKYGYINSIPDELLQTIVQTLDTAYTIPLVTKKKFAIRK